jgi:thymidylate synthase (FAD)
MVLPQSMMTEWIWTGSLAAFARVCKQRISGDAQEETRFIAEDISDQLSGVAPVSWAVLTSG